MNPYISIENSLNKVYIFVQIGLLGCNYVDTIESLIWKRVNFNFALRANTNTQIRRIVEQHKLCLWLTSCNQFVEPSIWWNSN